METEEILDTQLLEEDRIIKEVDRELYARRIAIEVKAHMEVYNEGHPTFKAYLLTAREQLNYSAKDKEDILILAKEILDKEYDMKFISSDPFMVRQKKIIENDQCH